MAAFSNGNDGPSGIGTVAENTENKHRKHSANGPAKQAPSLASPVRGDQAMSAEEEAFWRENDGAGLEGVTRISRDLLESEIDDAESQATVIHYLLTAAPVAIEGSGGRKTTLHVIQRCGDLGCSREVASQLMERYWNDRCDPPWDDGQIEKTSRGLKRANPLGCSWYPARAGVDIAPIKARSVQPPRDEGVFIFPPKNDEPPRSKSSFVQGLGEPKASYAYRNEDGEALAYVDRFELPDGTKEFRPHTYRRFANRTCRWARLAPPAPRPLYRLDRIAKHPNATVIVCEGEKATDAAAQIFEEPNFVVTTSMGGARNACWTDWSPLAGRNIVIWPDADSEGERYASDVASPTGAIGCTVAIIDAMELASIGPDGARRLPKSGWDAADATDEGWDIPALRMVALGNARPIAEGAAQESDDAPEPERTEPPDAEPESSKSERTEEPKTERQSEQTEQPEEPKSEQSNERKNDKPKAPPSIIDPWEEFPVPEFPLDTLPPVVADYVDVQSAVIGVDRNAMAMATLAAISGAISHEVTLRMNRHDSEFAVTPCLWVLMVGHPGTKKTPTVKAVTKPLIKRHKLEKAAHRKALSEWEADLSKDKATRPVEPAGFVSFNATPEALVKMMAGTKRGILTVADELSGLIARMEKPAFSDQRSLYLHMRSGGYYEVNRITRSTDSVDNLSSSLLGGIQPKKLAELPGLDSDGLIQRFCPVMMKAGTVGRDEQTGPAVEAYEKLVDDCLGFKPWELIMTEQAMTRMRRMRQFFTDLANVGDALSDGLRNFVDKLAGLAGNLALVLHVARDPSNVGNVDDETMASAERIIMEFILPHAVAFYEAATGNIGAERMRATASYILTSRKPILVAGDFTKYVRALRGLDLFELKRAVSPLVAGGWLSLEDKNPSRPRWVVMPGVAELMEGRRIEEVRRKEALGKLMKARWAGKS
jgi:hypothetical protein